MMLYDTLTLSNGVAVPRIGIGTWKIADDAASVAVQQALAIGYRHVDTAQAYANEAGVGRGVRASDVPRDEIFVTTKLAAEVKDYDEAVRSIDGSLDALGLDVIDLMIIHSPQPWAHFGSEDRYVEGNRAAWRALEDAYNAGKLRAIGVSNFTQGDLESLLDGCTIRPMVNQILAHISNTPFELIQFAHSLGIAVEAYSPIAHGHLMKNERVARMAEAYGVTVPQLAIRYGLQLGMIVLPKTSKPDHMRSNAAVDFEISDADMQTLKNLPQIEDYGEDSVMPVFGVRA